ncbi:hypothetical protein AB0Q93_31185, partial [Streptomyces sp. NPDC088184]
WWSATSTAVASSPRSSARRRCFRPPSVPDGVSRLRLTARADLTGEQIATAVSVLRRTAPVS